MRKVMLILVAAVVAVAAWSQATKKTRTAEISGKQMEYRWTKNEFEFTGGCVLKIHGPTAATMKAPRVVFQLTADGRTVKLLKAFGPVDFTATTPPDSEGHRRRISGHCTKYATYDEENGVIEVVGDAVADLVTLPETPESPRAHFSGDVITINLKKGIVRATPAHLRYEGIIGGPKKPSAKSETSGKASEGKNE